MKEITFKGKPYLFTGETDKEGAICTKKAYENGDLSYAHLFPNGDVKRFLKVIGNIDDIEFGNEIEVDVKPQALTNMLFGFLELFNERMKI